MIRSAVEPAPDEIVDPCLWPLACRIRSLAGPRDISRRAPSGSCWGEGGCEALDSLLLEGEIATCGIIDLEMLYSATSPATYKALAEALRGMPRVPLDETAVERALEVQAKLAERSQHRAVPLPDLLVAACAESADLTGTSLRRRLREDC